MSNPEISRRCPSCGASIRDVALFCAQCGKGLEQRETAETAENRSALFAAELTTTRSTAPLEDPEVVAEKSMSDTVALDPLEPIDPQPTSMSDTIAIEPKTTLMSDTIAINRSQKTLPPSTGPTPKQRGAVGAKLQRAGTIARGVEGNVIHRVQKAREISSVVIDEAGYDPSLRFVLVAVGLFGLFLLIVLLNKVIT
ncbi:MAG TPA: zinc ribbon domain-containing protein [Pyrinomonadaceae bacterium]|nr:zinc ribbon domain-containing protein [Pyrinomonadaceae bacterium]